MRMNIDEKWKTDPRRKALVKRLGSDRSADGMLVEITWVLFSHRGEGIPLDEFKFIEDHETWLACGLGYIDGDWVRISGSDRYEEFFEKQSQNGAKGGRPRKNPTKPNETQNNPTEPNGNPEKPSFSSSCSSSISKKAGEERPPPPASQNEFIGPVLAELAGNSKREQVLSQISVEQQQEWVDRYDTAWLRDSLLHAIANYAKDAPVDCVKGWPEKLARWFKIEKKPKLKARSTPAKVLEPSQPWPVGSREKALADPEIAKIRERINS